MPLHYNQHPSSFRDPSGFVFEKDGVLYRQVNLCFKESYDHFISSGCYDALVKKRWLISHTEWEQNITGTPEWYKTLRPDRIRFITYPYEWSFTMLKDAAELTLKILRDALSYGLVLKDATPYNIQWHRGRMLFIDTLSFEKYDETAPWVAYRQFCENFLSPLLLMHYGRTDLSQLFMAWPKGIPLHITRSLLPWRSRFNLHTYLHIHLHARVSAKGNTGQPAAAFSKQKLLNLVSSLETLIGKLKAPKQSTTWSSYYEEASARPDYLQQKKVLVTEWINQLHEVSSAVDLGTNEGDFAKLTAAQNVDVLASDFDARCIDTLYKDIRNNKEQNIQPMVLDLSNPSPAIGVNNVERLSFIRRTRVDLVMALALIHHLVIAENMSFAQCADLFTSLGRWLIIEFVPKEDEKVQQMLNGRKDIFDQYQADAFEAAMGRYYSIKEKKPVGNSGRTLYLMLKHDKLASSNT